MKRIAACLLVMLFLSCPVAAADPTPEHRQPVARLIGTWSGTSTYLPQEKNKSGEVHERWGMFSHDKQRKTLMLRQFHVENFNNLWNARESHELPSDDELVEVLELAPPGQPWRIYSRTQLRRTSR